MKGQEVNSSFTEGSWSTQSVRLMKTQTDESIKCKNSVERTAAGICCCLVVPVCDVQEKAVL